jgi:hypothetical protein
MNISDMKLFENMLEALRPTAEAAGDKEFDKTKNMLLELSFPKDEEKE